MTKDAQLFENREKAREFLKYEQIANWSEHKYQEPYSQRLVAYDDDGSWYNEVYENPLTGEIIVF